MKYYKVRVSTHRSLVNLINLIIMYNAKLDTIKSIDREFVAWYFSEFPVYEGSKEV